MERLHGTFREGLSPVLNLGIQCFSAQRQTETGLQLIHTMVYPARPFPVTAGAPPSRKSSCFSLWWCPVLWYDPPKRQLPKRENRDLFFLPCIFYNGVMSCHADSVCRTNPGYLLRKPWMWWINSKWKFVWKTLYSKYLDIELQIFSENRTIDDDRL